MTEYSHTVQYYETINVECNYRKSSTFSDEISIQVSVAEYKGVKLVLQYKMRNQLHDFICDAKSTHCFMDRNNKPIRMARQFLEFHETLLSLIGE